MKEKLKDLGLELNETKTSVVDTRKGQEGFDFLGFYHRQVKSTKYRKYYLQKWPGRKAMNRLRATIREFLGKPSTRLWSLPDVVKKLNPILRGWMNYFRFGNSSKKFGRMDYYVHESLALWWSKKHHKSGRRWNRGFTTTKRKACGIQRMTGNVLYWSHYLRMRKNEGHRKAV